MHTTKFSVTHKLAYHSSSLLNFQFASFTMFSLIQIVQIHILISCVQKFLTKFIYFGGSWWGFNMRRAQRDLVWGIFWKLSSQGEMDRIGRLVDDEVQSWLNHFFYDGSTCRVDIGHGERFINGKLIVISLFVKLWGTCCVLDCRTHIITASQ